MEVIYGKVVADKIMTEVKDGVSALREGGERAPRLAIIRIGDRPDHLSYEKAAIRRMDMVGIEHEVYVFSEKMEKLQFYEEFHKINKDERIDGLLLLRPLPLKFEEEKLVQLLRPEKDVDAISPLSLGRLMSGEEKAFAPCTALAVIEILDYQGLELRGKKVTVVGRSNVVGRPLALLLISRDATVTVCHRGTENLEEEIRAADIVVAACGSPKLIKREHIKKGAVLVDVGISLDEEGRLSGDIDMEDVKERASLCTPVPGGVGAVTTAVLAKQVLLARTLRG